MGTLSAHHQRLPLAAEESRSRDPQPDIMWRKPSNPSLPLEEEVERLLRARGDGGRQENKTLKSAEQGASELRETEAARTGPTGSAQPSA